MITRSTQARGQAGRRSRPVLVPGVSALALGAMVMVLRITVPAQARGVSVPAPRATAPQAAGARAASGTASGATWKLRLAIHYLPPATNRSSYDAVLAEPGLTWFFGGSNVGGRSKPEAEKLRNGRPVSVPLPPRPHSWITAISATSRHDIWAVTYLGGSVLRWNGSAWSAVPRGNWRPGTRFTGIAAAGPRDVWVFGTTSVRYLGAGTWHFNGTSWTRATGAAGGLYQASIARAGDIWGIGVIRAGFGVAKDKALLHFNGSAWRRVRPPALAGFIYSRVLAVRAHDVWVAGSVAGRPELGHFDGSRWTALTMPGSVAATGMCRDGRGGLWVVTTKRTGPSVMRHRSARGTWTRSVVSAGSANAILACARVPGTTRIWGAGRAAAPHGSAAAAYRHG